MRRKRKWEHKVGRKKPSKTDRKKARQQAIRKKEAELKKKIFFDPTYDPVFKMIFEKVQTLVHFLNAILHLDGERRFVFAKSIKPTIHLKNTAKLQKIARFDVHAQTADGHYVDVEMQRAGHDNLLERIELYSAMLTINAKMLMDHETSKKEWEEHPYRMPHVYSIWICNFSVAFCNSYREEIALYRHSDLAKSDPLPIYPKKRYIVIDLTKYVPQKENSSESEWINLFKTMSDAKRVPKGKDEIINDAYERSRVSKATKKYIKKVAAYMVTKEEISTRMGTARREGFAEGEAKANKKFATRDKKIADFLRSIGVSKKNIDMAFAIK